MKIVCSKCHSDRFTLMQSVEISGYGQITPFPFSPIFLSKDGEKNKPLVVCGTCHTTLTYEQMFKMQLDKTGGVPSPEMDANAINGLPESQIQPAAPEHSKEALGTSSSKVFTSAAGVKK